MNLLRGACALVVFATSMGCGGDGKGAVMVVGGGAPIDHPTMTLGDGGVQKITRSTTGPIVTLMSPLASSDPIAGPVLSGPSVDVKCEAKPRTAASPVDPTKITVAVYAETSADPIATIPATLQGTDLYGASVPLSAVPTGGVRFRCSAADKGSSAPVTGWNDVYTFYDAGPVIAFTNLNEMSVIARGTDTAVDLAVQFTVTPARLSSDDTGADVADVKLSISEHDVTLGPPVVYAYDKEIDFLDFFAGAPIESVTIAVTATNKRTGAVATSKKQIIVKVDGKGPVVNITSPQLSNGQPPIVGGTVALIMTITDDLAGVAEGADKLFAQIPYAGMSKTYPLIASGNNTYSFTFEASQFSETSNIDAQIHAIDKAGNKTLAPFAMRLDTIPPWVSVDPPHVRIVTGNPPLCSGSFDPLGDSPSDGEVVPRQTTFRAFVWERGIEIEGAKEIWVAGVRNDSVTFYAQRNPVPLIVNRSGSKNGFCDSINTGAAVDMNVPLTVGLTPIATGGNEPVAGSGMTDDFSLPPSVAAIGCGPYLGSPAAPKCGLSDMSYVVAHSMEGHPSVIYGS
ncbi:MAG: hypothetical protein JWN04_6496, partial [Myxococcaceae bacterium]|nr:hypothetical protein [Myxococcaceae bacterium]